MNYFKKHVGYVLIIGLISIIIAFSLGLFIRDWPVFQIDNRIKVTEFAGFLFTVILALLIPKFLNNTIEKVNKTNSLCQIAYWKSLTNSEINATKVKSITVEVYKTCTRRHQELNESILLLSIDIMNS